MLLEQNLGVLNKILVKVLKDNGKYSIVTNYTTEELKELDYTVKEIKGMAKITIYDEILVDPDIQKLNKELN